MLIDGREHRWRVRLSEGMLPEQRRTPIQDLAKLASGQKAAVA